MQSKTRQLGNVKLLNSFIYDQHEKLNLKRRSEDPYISENAFKMAIDDTQFQAARKRFGQDKTLNTMDQATNLTRQNFLLNKHMGSAKVDSGYSESMFNRLFRAKQGREDVKTDAWKNFMEATEKAILQKHID